VQTQLIPVLDLCGGIVVRAVAGRRSEYRPLRSLLTAATEPVEVLENLRVATGLETFYVADLDGIMDARPDWESLQRLTATGARLMIDAGVRCLEELNAVRLGSNVQPVIATETWGCLKQLPVDGASDVICSLDLHAGSLRLADREAAAAGVTLEQLTERLWRAGLGRWIILDTAAVGMGTGLPTLELCRRLRTSYPDSELISGGGVNSDACVREAESAGLDGLLVASALHDRRLKAFRGGQ
jgi:HisA/HisF family protein